MNISYDINNMKITYYKRGEWKNVTKEFIKIKNGFTRKKTR